MVLHTNILDWFFHRYDILLLTFFLLYIPNNQGYGQESGVDSIPIIYPETIFPDTTIEYIEGGNFNYLNSKGQTVGGGRKQDDGSYKIYYKGKVKQKGYLFGSVIPKDKTVGTCELNGGMSGAIEKDMSKTTEHINPPVVVREHKHYPPSISPMVVVEGGKEVIRYGINKTKYDSNGKPYYHYGSAEMSTSHIKDPKIRAQVRYEQVKEWTRQREADRKR